MKILMTLMGLEIGGAETHVVELAKELNKQGHTVIVASNGGIYEEALAKAGIRHEKIPMHQRKTLKMLHSLQMLRCLIQQEKPDLVNAHARIPAFLCGILHKQMHFPFITTAHGIFEITPVLRRVTDWGQLTLSVSEDIKAHLMQQYHLPADRIHLTINGIDTDRFAPGPVDEALAGSLGLGDGPIIGTVSRLDAPQEIAAKELIKLMPQVLQEFPNAQLLVVGGGDQEVLLSQQAEQINRQTGTNTVIMTGARTDIAQLVLLADVFVGVSRSALEAMAEEKTTILAGGQGYIGPLVPEVLAIAQESNLCGRGCAPVSPERLLEDLLSVLRMPEDRRRELGRFGRQVVLEQYSVSKMTQDYLQAYEQLLHPVKPIRAAISGYYGYGNLGDDAILLAISRQLARSEQPVQLTVLSRHPEDTTSQYGLRAVHRFSPQKVYRTLKDCDVLISGGGSLLQDKTSTRSLLYYLAVIRLAKLLKKPIFVYANGIGPLIKMSNRRKVRECMDLCDVITLRDQNSLAELRALGVTRQDITITGDPAFTLQPGTFTQRNFDAFGIPHNASMIGISVRNVSGREHYAKEFAQLCDRLVRERGKAIVFLVMQESEDEAISRHIQTLMEEPSYLVKTPGDPGTMLALIEKMDTMISMRLHTIIFAAGVNVPVVGCVYDPKVGAFLDMLHLPSCGTPATIDAGEAYRITTDLLDKLPEHRQQLSRCVKELTPLAEETAKRFERLMKNQPGR